MSKCEQCIVRKFNPLKTLTKTEVIRISGCKTVKRIKKGEILFNEGEHINGIYCIKNGVCKLSKISENGRNQIINLIDRGSIVGERCLVSDEVSNLSAVALNDMEICFIPKEEIVSSLQQNPNFSFSFLQTMADNLKNANNLVVNMAQKTVKQRLADTLLYLFKNYRSEEKNNIDLHLSREDFADIIGAATESTIRLLSEFKKKNLIEMRGKEIFIVNEKGLENIAAGF